jgi:hypothetical protein
VSFFLYKQDLTEDDKKDFARAARVEIVSEEGRQHYEGNNFEPIWQWFFLRKIVEHSVGKSVFVEDDNFKKLQEIVESPKRNKDGLDFRRLFPKLKNGNLEVSVDPNNALDVDFESEKQSVVKFTSIIKVAEQYLQRALPGNKKLYILCDELELGLGTAKEYKRDVALVRDLIVAIRRYNSVFRKSGLPIYIMAGIRSEVLLLTASAGKEINKDLEDCGVEIRWNNAGSNVTHPLLSMVCRKIQASSNETVSDEIAPQEIDVIWNNYFVKTIHGKDSQKFILHNTWYKPRDLVRMLTLAKDQNPAKRKFDQACFDETKKTYSDRSWTELTEELSTAFGVEGVRFFEVILTGYQEKFTVEEFNERIFAIEKYHLRPNSLKHVSSEQILDKLYRVGILGNLSELKGKGTPSSHLRFSFRGDTNPVMTERFIIHNALRSHLSI